MAKLNWKKNDWYFVAFFGGYDIVILEVAPNKWKVDCFGNSEKAYAKSKEEALKIAPKVIKKFLRNEVRKMEKSLKFVKRVLKSFS